MSTSCMLARRLPGSLLKSTSTQQRQRILPFLARVVSSPPTAASATTTTNPSATGHSSFWPSSSSVRFFAASDPRDWEEPQDGSFNTNEGQPRGGDNSQQEEEMMSPSALSSSPWSSSSPSSSSSSSSSSPSATGGIEPNMEKSKNNRGGRLNSSNHDDDFHKIEKATTTLLRNPPGLMTTTMFGQAVHLLFTMSKRARNMPQDQRPAVYAEDLLERIIFEGMFQQERFSRQDYRGGDNNNGRYNRNRRRRDQDESSQEPIPFAVNASMYNACLDAWAKYRGPEASKRAEGLLERMQERHKNENLPPLDGGGIDGSRSWRMYHPPPDTITYNTLLNAFACCKTDPEATHKVEEIVAFMEDVASKVQQDPTSSLAKSFGGVAPDSFTYNNVILAYANRSEEYGAARKAEDWLLRLSEIGAKGGKLHVQTREFNLVLKAWANSEDQRAPERAMEILRLMIKLQQQSQQDEVGGALLQDIRPDVLSFLTVISAYAKRGDPEGAQAVLQLAIDTLSSAVQQQSSSHEESSENITKCLNALLHAWSASGRPDSAVQAERLLQEAMGYSESYPHIQIQPDAITYCTCLQAFINAAPTPQQAAQQAQDFLERLVDSYQRGETTARPVAEMFPMILRLWAMAGLPDRADAFLQYNLALAAKHPSLKIFPSFQAFNICIDSWTKSGRKGSVEHTMGLLEQLESIATDLAKRHFCHPTAFSYNCCITNIRRQIKTPTDAAQRALELLRRSKVQQDLGNTSGQPDIIMYNQVVDLLSKTQQRRDADCALDILEDMERKFLEGMEHLEPDTATYTSTLHGYTQNADDKIARKVVQIFEYMEKLHADPRRKLTLDLSACRTILLILGRARSEFAAYHSAEIVNRMIGRGDPKLLPDGGCLASCIMAYTRSGTIEGIETAHHLLHRFLELREDGTLNHYPHPSSFTSVAHAWSFVADDVAIEKAREILSLSRRLEEEGKIKDDCRVHSALLHVLAARGKPHEAEEFLHEIRGYGDRNAPDVIMWNTVLNAWAKSSLPNKAVEAKRCLDDMIRLPQQKEGDSYVSPDVVSFNSVLTAAASETELGSRDQAFEIGSQVFQMVQQRHHIMPSSSSRSDNTRQTPPKQVGPDHVTYGLYIKLHRLLRPNNPERTNAIKNIFQDCCSKGLVGPFVMKEMMAALSTEEQKTVLVGITKQTFSPSRYREVLPAEWTASVKNDRNLLR